MFETIRFSLFELIALFGLVQSVSVLVYMSFRAGNVKQAILPFLYFGVLGGAFYSEFARISIVELQETFDVLAFFFWGFIPALSVLLIVQLARMPRLPHPAFYLFLIFPFMLIAFYFVDVRFMDEDNQSYLPVLHVIFGALTLLGLWMRRDVLSLIYQNAQNAGHERYWLAMALIFFNVLFLGGVFLDSVGVFQDDMWALLRLILANVFVYLASTSLFRIYPQAVLSIEHSKRKVKRKTDAQAEKFNAEEQALLKRVIYLFEAENIYQESNLTRTELAQELKISEALLSRIVSAHYAKSVPQLINGYRVDDAIALIEQTDMPIKDIAIEAGFSSIATFNRVFKEQTGKSPSSYRKEAAYIIH
jgi:AraC-like DNA-binding protein